MIAFAFVLLYNSVFAQSQNLNGHKLLYHDAYSEISQMLEDKQPLNFKRAIFLMENAFLNGSWKYEQFSEQIQSITNKLQLLIKERHFEKFKTAGNWAAFTYMVDSISQNDFKPYKYDFDNFLPTKDPTVGFVTKLITTGKGNCVSLPELYKILTNELQCTAYLALAPMHCYIKHKDENGKWVNLEMTSGSFARDEWIMQESGVTVEQIKTGIYMNALTEKETLASVLNDLAANYQFQFGCDGFDLLVAETALKYYPKGVHIYMVKFEHYRKMLLQARQQNNSVSVDHYNRILFGIDQKLAELAYKEPSKQDYEEWVRDNEKNRLLQESKTQIKSNNK